jgi:hypothetical protein
MKRLLLLVLVFAAPGCIVKWSRLEKPSGYTHRVRYSGETLSIISAWYTNNPENWQRIAKLNSRKSPYTIGAGDLVYIPASILRKSSPMPPDYVHSFYRARPPQIRQAAVEEAVPAPVRTVKASAPKQPERKVGAVSTSARSPRPQVVKTAARRSERELANERFQARKDEVLRELVGEDFHY